MGRIVDQNGNGKHVTQPVAAKRPILRRESGLNYLEGDGVDDDLLVAPITYPLSTFGLVIGKSLPYTEAFSTFKSNVLPDTAYVGITSSGAPFNTSSAGGSFFINRAAFTGNRQTLRAQLETPKVATARDVATASFNSKTTQMLSYINRVPAPFAFYGYVEVGDMTAELATIAEDWVAEKTGVDLP